LAIVFNEIKSHVNTSLGLVRGCIPCIPPCVRACLPSWHHSRLLTLTFLTYVPLSIFGGSAEKISLLYCGSFLVISRSPRYMTVNDDGQPRSVSYPQVLPLTWLWSFFLVLIWLMRSVRFCVKRKIFVLKAYTYDYKTRRWTISKLTR